MSVPATVFHFNEFTLETRERRLTRNGQEIHLRPKTYDTLLYLVEHNGHLVTKNELLDALWPDVEVTENALTRCIKEVRGALQDEVESPRFIKTITRVGYKFISAVEEDSQPNHGMEVEEEFREVHIVETEEIPEPVSANTESDPTHSQPAVLIQPRVGGWIFDSPVFRPWGLALLAVMVLSIGATLWYFISFRKAALAFEKRDWILIADFENSTGDKVFNEALSAALERELSRSQYVNFVPPGRVYDTLVLMQKAPDSRISEATGREICLRDGGIRALLCGSIQQIGGVYSINLKLIDPAKGISSAVFDAQVPSRQEILGAISNLAAQVRRRLGESQESIAHSNLPLEHVTTHSLEALELYSKGLYLLDQFEWKQSQLFFDQAIQLDPKFAIAYWARGLSRSILGGAPCSDFQQAARMAEKVTLREKLTIEAFHAADCGNDLLKSIEIASSMIAQYPDDYWVHEILSWHFLAMGDEQNWKEHQSACLRIRPNTPLVHFHAGYVALFLHGDVEKADQEQNRALELNPNFPAGLTRTSKIWRHWFQDRMPEALQEAAIFRSKGMAKVGPSFQIMIRPYLARFYLFAGNTPEALSLLETNKDMTFPMANASLSSWNRFERALVYEGLGDVKQCERLLQDEAAESVGVHRIEALGWLAISLARRGLCGQARSLQGELKKEDRLPPSNFWHPPLPQELARAKQVFDRQIEGEILLSEKKYGSALSCFQEVQKLAPRRTSIFLSALAPRIGVVAGRSLGKVHEQQGEWEAAINIYRDILQHKELCISTIGVSDLWIQTLQSIIQVLEKAGRLAEAAKYREEYRRLRS